MKRLAAEVLIALALGVALGGLLLLMSVELSDGNRWDHTVWLSS